MNFRFNFHSSLLALRQCGSPRATLAAGAIMVALAAATLAPAPARAAEQTAPVIHKMSLPPSADLHYRIRAQQSGLTIDGVGDVKWHNDGDRFSVTSETRANLFGKVLEATTVGAIDQFGLAPVRFNDKRFRKEPTVTTFDRQGKTIAFSTSAATYPILGGEQDRNSVIWQLIGVARGTPARFKPGSEWRFFVAGQRDAEEWTFTVGKTEAIRTALGELKVVHVVRAPPPDSKAQKLDIWLAPSLEWYPAQLRFTDPDGEYVEQMLESVSKT